LDDTNLKRKVRRAKRRGRGEGGKGWRGKRARERRGKSEIYFSKSSLSHNSEELEMP